MRDLSAIRPTSYRYEGIDGFVNRAASVKPEDTVAVAGEPWTQSDVRILAREYFAVLGAERAGQSVNKNDALRQAQAAMPVHRTIHTLKDRCYRISEELWKRDLPYVAGWKPPQLVGQSPNSMNVAATIWAAIEPLVVPGDTRQPNSAAESATVLGGQAHMTDVERRKAIEEFAQRRLMHHFEERGWLVEDTRLGSPFDARATRGTEVRYLEAKGSTSEANTVMVTRGEVEWARSHRGECVMGIVGDIQFSADGAVVPHSGTFRLLEWDPDQGDIKPIQFEWAPPRVK